MNRDPGVGAMMLTGAGPAFCAGGDVRAMAARAEPFGAPPLALAESYVAGIQRIPPALHAMEVPTIAAVDGAVNGAAIGAGCDLAMMCNMRVAGVAATFGEVFVNLGIIPGDAGSRFPIRRLGHQRAAELTFSGRVVGAAEALEMGMVLSVHPDDALMEAARERAAVIASKPPRAVRIARRLLRMAERTDLPDFLDAAAAYQGLMHQTADHHEAMAAMLEQRAPRREGR